MNTIARIFFMDFSPSKNQMRWFLSADSNSISGNRGRIRCRLCVAAAPEAQLPPTRSGSDWLVS
jgi:hypothetical protein